MNPRGPRRLSRPRPDPIGTGVVDSGVEVGPRFQHRKRVVVAARDDRAASTFVVVAWTSCQRYVPRSGLQLLGQALTLRPSTPQALEAPIEHHRRVFLPCLFGIVTGCVHLGNCNVEVVLVVSPHVG